MLENRYGDQRYELKKVPVLIHRNHIVTPMIQTSWLSRSPKPIDTYWPPKLSLGHFVYTDTFSGCLKSRFFDFHISATSVIIALDARSFLHLAHHTLEASGA